MVLTDENGKRYKATPAGPRTFERFYKIEEIPTETPWWEKLPPSTPVEARDLDDEAWHLIRASYAHMWKQVRWPTAADGWAYAREHGFSHLVVWSDGEVQLTKDADSWPDEAVLVPIPQQEDSDNE